MTTRTCWHEAASAADCHRAQLVTDDRGCRVHGLPDADAVARHAATVDHASMIPEDVADYRTDGREPRIVTTAEQAYRALSIAAERIGGNNYSRQIAEHRRKGRSPRTFRFTVTDAHKRVVDAMPDVLAGRITPEQAMAILHEYDVFEQRMA